MVYCQNTDKVSIKNVTLGSIVSLFGIGTLSEAIGLKFKLIRLI